MHVPQHFHHVPSVQVAPVLPVNDWSQRSLRTERQSYAERQRQWQVYALWQAYAQLQQGGLLPIPLSPCNDGSATTAQTATPTRKRKRKPTLRSDIEDVKRAGLPIRSVQRTADGYFIHIGEPIIRSDNDNNDGASDRSEWQ